MVDRPWFVSTGIFANSQRSLAPIDVSAATTAAAEGEYVSKASRCDLDTFLHRAPAIDGAGTLAHPLPPAAQHSDCA